MALVRSPDQKTHGERCSTAPASQLVAHELVNSVTWHLSPPTAPTQNVSAHIGRWGMAQRRQQNVNIWKKCREPRRASNFGESCWRMFTHIQQGACGWVTPRAWSHKVRFFLLFGMLLAYVKGFPETFPIIQFWDTRGYEPSLQESRPSTRGLNHQTNWDRILKAGSGNDSANCPTSMILQFFDRHLGAGLHVRNQHGILLEDWTLKMYSRSFTFNKISFQNMHLSDSCLNNCLPSNIQTQHAPCAARGIVSTNFWQI